ncbi:MAG TPA: 2-phospho-L-lactate guanylyltransferase [Terriglobales bacterium]|jgi:2-phospho-L-lactate guanylyltransferase
MIIIPVKNLQTAKQRLAPLLDQPSRTELAQAMLLDVAEAIAAWSERPSVALVTSDAFAVDLAKELQFDIIPDSANTGESDAISMATQVCVSRGVDFTLVIPGDIPLLHHRELQAILEGAPEHGSVLVPAADGRGSNAVFRRPADLFPLRFGNDSFKPHVAAARATQQPCVVLSFPGIALDVDNAADLRRLVSLPGDTRSQRLAREWDLSELPMAASE